MFVYIKFKSNSNYFIARPNMTDGIAKHIYNCPK